MVKCLGEKLRQTGMRITAVATSDRTADLAREQGIAVVALDQVRWLDLCIDGADEFDGELNLVKGGGGALLREKIVATASEQMIVIADPAKEVVCLGAFPLPVEVIPFGVEPTRTLIDELLTSLDVMTRKISVRMNGSAPFVTDQGNRILDLHLGRIGNPRQLSLVLNQVPGVVENGLFIDICDIVVIGHPDGRVETRDITKGTVDTGRVPVPGEENAFADLDD
jgi:ribose 5-phosphate isomerase A